MVHVLIVDDEPQFRETLVRALKSAGVRATAIAETDLLASAVVINKPDIILLDMMFGIELGGIAACRALRNWNDTPVIVISVLDDNKTKIEALDAGADDYLVKPFDVDELLAHIRAIQRRLEHPALSTHNIVRVGDLEIDLERLRVMRKGQRIHLTRNELTVLRTLVQANGEIVSHTTLLQQVKINADLSDKASIRTLIRQLRRKLEKDSQQPEYILTETGLGYRFNVWHELPK